MKLKNPRVLISMTLLIIITLYGDSLAKNIKLISEIDPLLINAVEHPYQQEEITGGATQHMMLELFYQEENDILDEEEWFDQYKLTFPDAIAPYISNIPQNTRFGDLKFLRQENKKIFAVYEKIFALKEPRDIYDEGHVYTLIIIDPADDTIKAFSFNALYPDILEMCWFEVDDNLVYFNAAYNGYADIRNDKTGYLYCLDVEGNEIIWTTKNLISSYRGFILYEDHLITGYGFTAEPDYLYVLDRFTGKITQTIPIKTAHEYIIVKNKFCYVRTYNMNYTFEIIEQPYKR